MRAALLLLLAALGGSLGATRDQFCALCQRHTMCLYDGVSARCRQGRQARGVAPAEQAAIVELTNRLRNRVALGQEWRGAPGPQPPAQDMQRVVWDDEVAAVAQRWADQCNYSHDTCRNVPDTYVGQNIYQRSQYPVSAMGDAANWTEPIMAWYDEVALMPASAVGSYQNREDIGHYTQTVWAATNRIGCGFAFFQDGDWAKKYYVCNYAPGGNAVGQALYRAGAPRAACATTADPDPALPGLCGRAPPAGPAGANPAGTNVANAIPAGTNLANAIPAGTIPAGAIPAGTIPAGTNLANTIPVGTNFADAIPAGTNLVNAVPAGTNFANSVGSGAPFLADAGAFSPDYF